MGERTGRVYESRASVCGGGGVEWGKRVCWVRVGQERECVCAVRRGQKRVCVCSGGESFARERVWGERVFWVRIGK